MAVKRRKPPAQIWPYIVYGGLALAVLLPLLLPGHILTLDMVFTPHIPMPDHVTSSYLFRVLLHGLNVLVPTQIIEKLLWFLILFLSGISVHQLARYVQEKESVGTYVAGAFYMINPFTYSRFMAGQYSVLLGYAVLPFFVLALLQFLQKPAWRSGLKVALWVILISIISIHTLGLLILVSIVALVLSAWRFHGQSRHLMAIMKYGLAGLALVLLASCYWLVPLLQGRGETAQTIASFDKGDMQAFATTGSSITGQIGNLAGLQGFWAEGRGLYALPQDRLPLWGFIVLTIWILVVNGGVALWRSGKKFETALFVFSSLGAIALSVGGTNSWLAEHVPLFAGFREPHKFIGLVALMYALFIGQATIRLIQRYRNLWGDITPYLVTAAIGLVLVAYTPTMLWGFGGQLRPRHYPADWFVVNEKLNQDKTTFKVLFLPWHLYMHFDFAGRIIANPAEDFFDQPVIVSNDPEFGEASLTDSDQLKQQLDQVILPEAAKRDQLGTQLAPLNITYVILAKEADAKDYDFINRQKELKLMYEGKTLKLYRNTNVER